MHSTATDTSGRRRHDTNGPTRRSHHNGSQTAATGRHEPRPRNPEGNARLTAIIGNLILPLFVVAFVTALQAKSGLLSVHVAVGLVLAAVVGVKLSSVTYRMLSYYRGVVPYRQRGKPAGSLRLLGGTLGVLMMLLLGSGLVLLLGPSSAHAAALPVHKLSGYLAVIAVALHLVAHLRDSLQVGTGDLRRRALRVPGATARWALLAGALVLGGAMAVLLTGHASTYSHQYYPGAGAATAKAHMIVREGRSAIGWQAASGTSRQACGTPYGGGIRPCSAR